MTKIKICGLSRPEDIDYVNEARPDYCGFVIGVPSSRRNISVETLYRLRSRLSDQVTAVGVFVNTEAELPARLLKDGVISLAQNGELTRFLEGKKIEKTLLDLYLQEDSKSPLTGKIGKVLGRGDKHAKK